MNTLNHPEGKGMNTFNKPSFTTSERRPWQPPAVKTVGTISQVLQGGGGKLSTTGGDPGENRKQSGGGA
jgi:hypothetical protein